jgi:hypothetical protein
MNPQIMEMLMALMGQKEQEPDETITVVDEMQGSPMVDLTGELEDEAPAGGDMMAQLMAAFQQ